MSSSNTEIHKIEIIGVLPTWYTSIPNMAIYDLKPNPYKLLAVYLDMAAENLIYAQNSTVAERLGTSINTMKSARNALKKAGYIDLHKGTATQTARVVIKLGWIWKRNLELFNERKQNRVSKSDSQNAIRESKSDSGVSKSDTNKELNNKELDSSKKELELVPPIPADDEHPSDNLEEIDDSDEPEPNGSVWDTLTDNQKTHRLLGMFFGRFKKWYFDLHGDVPPFSIGDVRAKRFNEMKAIASHSAKFTVAEFIQTVERLRDDEWYVENKEFPSIHKVAMNILLTRQQNESMMDNDSQETTSNFSDSVNYDNE